MRRRYSITKDISGVVVTSVSPRGRAYNKLRRADVIVEVNFQSVSSVTDTLAKVKAALANPSQPILIRVKRRGETGAWFDQFVSIVVDNGLGPVVGMPPGGYSNTWEWEEVLTFASTDQPVIGFMYSIGHTIRPNGEVLEGNPAALDAWVPLTAENVKTYYPLLLDRVRAHMEAVRR